MEMKQEKIIGLTEKVTLIGNNGHSKTIIARIDTGAVISSIDMKLAAELELGPVTKTKKVKNSNGISERPVVRCIFKLKNEEYRVDVTLADRSRLKYRALIGQNLLKKTKFLVNPRKKK
ncbi:ATP-dependent zinc protease [Candidatus Woesearchaeota archaeon]|nr:ATP-dependent zinc protease [Candidatus Woesearchaeota archaeon]